MYDCPGLELSCLLAAKLTAKLTTFQEFLKKVIEYRGRATGLKIIIFFKYKEKNISVLYFISLIILTTLNY